MMYILGLPQRSYLFPNSVNMSPFLSKCLKFEVSGFKFNVPNNNLKPETKKRASKEKFQLTLKYTYFSEIILRKTQQ
jgi:hypothetical protein